MRMWFYRIALPALVCSFAFQSFAAQEEPSPAGSATISGIVYEGSGSEKPLRRASVLLYTAEAEWKQAMAWTDSNGRFSFSYLPAGRYVMYVQKEGFQQAAYGGTWEVSTVIDLKAGENRTDFVFHMHRLGSISGTVLDETEGSPMKGCSAFIGRMEWTANGRTFNTIESANTNAKGEYSLKTHAGSYIVGASCENEVTLPHPFLSPKQLAEAPTMTYRSTYYPNAADLSGATRVKVAAGVPTTGIDIALQPLRGTLVVVSAPGVDLSKSSGVLHPKELSGVEGIHPTNAGGKMRFKHVPPGGYMLEILQGTEGSHLYALQSVQVGTGDVQNVEAELHPPITLKGTITLPAEKQRSRDPSFGDLAELTVKKPTFESVQIAFQPYDDAFEFAEPPVVRVQADGTFTVENLFPGRYHVQVFGPGVVGYVETINMGDKTVAGNLISITSGASGPLSIKTSTVTAPLEINIAGMPPGLTYGAVVAFTQDDPENDRKWLSIRIPAEA